jgi:hypothetical protein
MCGGLIIVDGIYKYYKYETHKNNTRSLCSFAGAFAIFSSALGGDAFIINVLIDGAFLVRFSEPSYEPPLF